MWREENDECEGEVGISSARTLHYVDGFGRELPLWNKVRLNGLYRVWRERE